MHRKVGSFMNMAAEIGGRGGKGGMVHGVRSLGRYFSLHLPFPPSIYFLLGMHEFEFRVMAGSMYKG